MLISVLVRALLGGVGGAIGFIIAVIIQRGTGAEPPSRWPAILGLIMAVGMTRSIMAQLSSQSLDQEMATLEKNEPIYSTIRTHDPDAYSKLLAIVTQYRAQPGDVPAFRAKLRGVIAEISARRLKIASDTQKLNLASLLSDEMSELRKASPATCIQLLSPTGADIAPYVSEELKRRDAAMTESLIVEPPGKLLKTLQQNELQAILRPVIGSISSDTRLPITAVVNTMGGNGAVDDRYLVGFELFRRMGRLPDNNGAAVI